MNRELLLEISVFSPVLVMLAGYAKDVACIVMSVSIENEVKVARDGGNTMELVNDVTGSAYDSELAQKDGEVVEDSICGRVTDTVFVKDDPREEGKDRDSVMSMAPSDCTAAEDVDENIEVLGLGFVGTN